MINQIKPITINSTSEEFVDKINEIVHMINVLLPVILSNPMLAKAYRDEYRKYHGKNPD